MTDEPPPPVAADESTLIDRCLEGDRSAWNELVDRHSRLVYSIPLRYGMGEADAADVVQNVFIAVYSKLDRLRDHQRLTSWIITTTHRECWRLSRRGRREQDLPEEVPREPDPDQVDRWERQQIVREALGVLGGRCEALLTALFLQLADSSYDQIAEQLGIPVGSIGPTRARCFRKLEAILVKMGAAPEVRTGS